ncbi:unnamed protein product [Musa textilis]
MPYLWIKLNLIVFLLAKWLSIFGTLLKSHTKVLVVKDSKMNLLMPDFEPFRMAPSETIDDIYTRFTDVVNSLKALGKCFLNFELINKILRSLPKRWDPKVITIQETKDLKFFSIEGLIGSLMT